eukprot:238292-Rhodomonas_salina.2
MDAGDQTLNCRPALHQDVQTEAAAALAHIAAEAEQREVSHPPRTRDRGNPWLPIRCNIFRASLHLPNRWESVVAGFGLTSSIVMVLPGGGGDRCSADARRDDDPGQLTPGQ